MRGEYVKLLILSLMVATVVGCSPDDKSNDSDALAVESALTGSGQWVKLGQCYWQLDIDRAKDAFGAWVLTDLDGGTGTAIAFSDRDKFPSVPTSDDAISISLVPDGDTSRTIDTKGWHPPHQGAHMISGEFHPAHQRALVGAKTIALYVENQKISEVPTVAFPSLDELAECDSLSERRGL